MDIQEALSSRRSIRDYADIPLDDSTLNTLIAAATQAPSAMNEQPWTFTVVRNRALLDRVSQAAKAHLLAQMQADPAASARAERLHSTLGNPDFQVFHHAPVLIVIGADAPGAWITEDCAMAAQNLMLMAHALGLGTCWIGFAQAYLNTAAGREALGASAAWVAVAPIIVGHPRTRPAPVQRKKPPVRWCD